MSGKHFASAGPRPGCSPHVGSLALRVAVALTITVGLQGCGYLFGDKGVFRDTSNDYKRAEELPPLQLVHSHKETAPL